MLTEWTSSTGEVMDQTSVSEGIGGCASIASTTLNGTYSARNRIQGFHAPFANLRFSPNGIAAGSGINESCVRRYQVTLGLGLLTQGKLLPTKFMASQLAVEITLANPTECIFACGQTEGPLVSTPLAMNPTYSLSNINMIPEILEFDASYDNMFLKGLQEGGVPIKFSSWHTYQFTHPGGLSANILIQERSRSVKSIFTVIRRQQTTFYNDSGALFSNLTASTQMDSYQYRIGGRYFPASPVQVGNGTNLSIGSAEAFVELQKALHTVGDSRLSTNVSALNWAPRYVLTGATAAAVAATSTQESDGTFAITTPTGANAVSPIKIEVPLDNIGVPTLGVPSACFCMAVSLETTSGMEISGLNAEEQSDISLNIKWTGTTAPNPGEFLIETYVFYDAMIVLRENNVFTVLTQGLGTYPIGRILKSMFSNKIWITLSLKLIPPMLPFRIVL
jgi:hypothetical protein